MRPGMVSQRDWLGWLFAVLLALLGALSTIAWNGLKDRIANVEQNGSMPLRLDVSRLTSEVTELQRRIDAIDQEADDLRDQVRALQYSYEPNAATPARPRYPR